MSTAETNPIRWDDSSHEILEHGDVKLTVPAYRLDIYFRYLFDKYSRLKFKSCKFLITTNYRVTCEKKSERDLKYFAASTEHHYKRLWVRFIMDRVESQSVKRHRGRYGTSFAQESTRFCNYSNEKKFAGMTFVIPMWMYDLRDELSRYITSLDDTSNEWMRDYTGAEMVRMLECHSRAASPYVDTF